MLGTGYVNILLLYMFYNFSRKSTLLDVIADRKNTGMWSGQILIDGLPRSKFFNRRSAYVLQDDVHIATLTVEEVIWYAAWTRMPEHTPGDHFITSMIS